MFGITAPRKPVGFFLLLFELRKNFKTIENLQKREANKKGYRSFLNTFFCCSSFKGAFNMTDQKM